ncbi:MAG: ORF6N domain-containing protein [Salinivirgaceae bacterium]|nr:ORF6N domain-containing protein [Salinivirgaceae bacterium]
MQNEITVIQNKILVIRNQQVMIDRDIAELYGVETKRLNEQVKRNIERFPEEFMFALNKAEKDELVANCDRFNTLKHSTVMPYAFTEQGVAMLSAVLKSETAIQASIQIMKAFVAMRKFLLNNAQIFQRLDSLEMHRIESDKRIDELFDRMDRYAIDDTQGIFFQGQIFDAYAKFESFIAQARQSIVLIDNYIDLSVLERFAKKNAGVRVTIYTNPQTPIMAQDIQRFNAQYPLLEVKHTSAMHDRFLIIDNQTLYHIGASLKDLGKRCFAFDVFDSSFIADIMARL